MSVEGSKSALLASTSHCGWCRYRPATHSRHIHVASHSPVFQAASQVRTSGAPELAVTGGGWHDLRLERSRPRQTPVAEVIGRPQPRRQERHQGAWSTVR